MDVEIIRHDDNLFSVSIHNIRSDFEGLGKVNYSPGFVHYADVDTSSKASDTDDSHEETLP